MEREQVERAIGEEGAEGKQRQKLLVVIFRLVGHSKETTVCGGFERERVREREREREKGERR